MLIVYQKLVPRESACLDGHRRIPLDVRHAMMNKFRSPDDGNFKLVASSLKEIVDNARLSHSLSKTETEILQYLASDYRGDKDRNEKRVPKTCEWLLNHNKFRVWRQKNRVSLLWVSADPGCGKSVLSKALVDEGLLSLDGRNSSVCYYFFKDDDSSRQSEPSALCALLHQLFVQKPALIKYAISTFEAYGEKICTMSGALWDILMKVTTNSDLDEIVCILDALDECQEASRNSLIKRLGHFQSAQTNANTTLKFVITSRPYSEIEFEFNSVIEDMSKISLKGAEESENISKEIDLVVDYQISQIAAARRPPLEDKVQDALITHLKKAPQRTYLWLHLILDQIRKDLNSTEYRLKKLVDTIPQTLYDMYESILGRINNLGSVNQARTILHIILAAERPLSLQELNVALAVDEHFEEEGLDRLKNKLCLEPQESFRNKIRNICGLFITIIDSKIFLIHQTAREFLISKTSLEGLPQQEVALLSQTWKHSFRTLESNILLLKICIYYLLSRNSYSTPSGNNLTSSVGSRNRSSRRLIDETLYENNLDYSDNGLNGDDEHLLGYAAAHWGTHFRCADIEEHHWLVQPALELCDSESGYCQNWCNALQLQVNVINAFKSCKIWLKR